MQEILDKMDKMKVQTSKKLDNVYQMVLLHKRRKRFLERKRKHLSSLSSNIPINSKAQSQSHEKSVESENLPSESERRRKLFQENKFQNGMFRMPRELAINQQDLYNFGRIAEQEQNFDSLVNPSLTQMPQQP